MNNLRNKTLLIGHLGAKPEMKISGEVKMTRVSIATNESYKSKTGEKINNVQWHSIVAWGNLAEILEKYTEKGSQIAVEGKLVNNNYTDKEGIKRYSTDIHITDLLLLDSKNNQVD